MKMGIQKMTDTTKETGKKESEYEIINDALEKMGNVDEVRDHSVFTDIVLKESEGVFCLETKIPFSIRSIGRYNGSDKMMLRCSMDKREITIVVPVGGEE